MLSGVIVNISRNDKCSIIKVVFDTMVNGVTCVSFKLDKFRRVIVGDRVTMPEEYVTGTNLLEIPEEFLFIYPNLTRAGAIKAIKIALNYGGFLEAYPGYDAERVIDYLDEARVDNNETLIQLMNNVSLSTMCYPVKCSDLDSVLVSIGEPPSMYSIMLHLCSKWFYKMIERPLYLVGVYKNGKYNTSLSSPLELYHECISDPFSVGLLELKTMVSVYKKINKAAPPRLMIDQGELVRKVYHDMEKGNSYIKCIRELTDIPKCLRLFNGKLFIRRYRDMEKQVCVKFKELSRNRIEPINRNYESICTDEQLSCIDECMSKGLSVLRGEAGTGKCLDPNEEVIMGDGTFKKVKDVKVDDILKSPHGKSRILSVCEGEDDMYTVSSNEGEYKCNSSHILTLFDRYEMRVVDIEILSIDQDRIYMYKSVYMKDGIMTIGSNIRIDFSHKGKYNGFTLTGSGRFILKNGIVTHNTTCILDMSNRLDAAGISYSLCSPTGVAARMMSLKSGKRCRTIHSLCYTPVKSEVIIIDETSMVTASTMVKLFNACTEIKQLIMVGDPNQIQPIGSGRVFSSYINSVGSTVRKLEKNHRVAEGSDILLNARRLIHKERIQEGNNFYMDEGNLNTVAQIVQELVTGGSKLSQTKILTCYNAEKDSLNEFCSSTFSSSTGYKIKNCVWRIGDSVMYMVNDTKKKLINGDQGTIVYIELGVICVEFSGRFFYVSDGNTNTPSFEGSDKMATMEHLPINMLTQSFAMTIDKAQGSEWENVIIYFGDMTNDFITLEKAYTAITRARDLCWIIGTNLECINMLEPSEVVSDLSEMMSI